MVQAAPTKTNVVTGIIDGDGHFFEHDELLYPYFDSAKHPLGRLRNYYLFPDLDGIRREGQGGWEFGDDAQGWLHFMDHAGISATVLYPTAGLAYAFVRDPEWAADLARAYNEFLADQYLSVSPRLQAVALIPVQDPPAAARELRHAVADLGFVGGLLPVPGLARPYGDEAFDILFREAQELNSMLAVHGAAYRDVGIDFPQSSHMGVGRRGFRYAHPAQPLTQMVQFANMLCEEVFERFPSLKVAFLEAGCGWAPYWVERIDRRAGRPLAANQIRNHPVYFQAELDEPESLRHFVSVFGEDRLIYASDYPHEPDAEITEGLNGFLTRQDVRQGLKEKLLRDNIRALYSLA